MKKIKKCLLECFVGSSEAKECENCTGNYRNDNSSCDGSSVNDNNDNGGNDDDSNNNNDNNNNDEQLFLTSVVSFSFSSIGSLFL